MHNFFNHIYYITLLDMFRASLCSCSGRKKIVCLQYLVSSHRALIESGLTRWVWQLVAGLTSSSSLRNMSCACSSCWICRSSGWWGSDRWRAMVVRQYRPLMTGPCQGDLTCRHWSMSPYWFTLPCSRPAGNLADASCTVDRCNTHGVISRNALSWLSALPCHQWQLTEKRKISLYRRLVVLVPWLHIVFD